MAKTEKTTRRSGRKLTGDVAKAVNAALDKKAMDVVVLPSIDGEGLPRALLEGGLLRRPTIGTRLSGSRPASNTIESQLAATIDGAGEICTRYSSLTASPARTRY